MQWVRVKRARWLGHILREDELSLVRQAILDSHARGEVGTLMDEAPPHRSIEHLCALARKEDNSWEDWCQMLRRTICPFKYEGLARAQIRQSIRQRRRQDYDPTPPTVIVPPPSCIADTAAAAAISCTSQQQQQTLKEKWDTIFAQTLTEVNERPIYNPEAPTDFYTDGSCTDNGKPFAAAGWGVHVTNSDRLGEYFGAVPGQVQTNN